jgi:hypothetical protein
LRGFSIRYPTMSQPLAFPDQVPLLSARMLAVYVQAGGHPLAYTNLAQLMPGRDTESSTVASLLNSLVVVPIETLQALGMMSLPMKDLILGLSWGCGKAPISPVLNV